MKLKDFTYSYPEELIAKYPADPPESSRLLIYDRSSDSTEHREFADIVEYFTEGDVLVVNNTKVFPARLYGKKKKTGAKIEVLLLRELNPESRLWDAMVHPARKIRIGNKLYFDDDLTAEVIDNTTSRGRTIRFSFRGTNDELYEKIDTMGETPIPPYIKRDAKPEDKEWYQTVFAEERGAVAAPTAGLHFSGNLVQKLQEKGVDVVPITLHAGMGTFRPVEVQDLTRHRMDSEYYEISPNTAEKVNRALKSNTNSVTAVGTTVVRAIETSLSASNLLKPGGGWTDKFIYPPYEFKITERLITNFHRPKSTLLMLVAAFAGFDETFEIYEEAIEEEYRLFSYGDAMLIQ